MMRTTSSANVSANVSAHTSKSNLDYRRMKNAESNHLTPCESKKISRNNSRHNMNNDYDMDFNRNRSNPNAIVDRD